MRKIRLSDTDLELFDIDISPADYTFYQRHKDAFRTMWTEQGKFFWIRFVITFRSFTIKHGVIKQMNIDSPKFQNLIDEAFIFIHEQFVDGKVSTAKKFLEEVAQLAQNQDKFPGLDSKSFSKDPFYARETRELFRKFFGKPDQKTSYLKVYVLCPVYLRFGGSICRCLVRWVDAEAMDLTDDSYWIPPQPVVTQKTDNHDTCQHSMCTECSLDAESKFMCEIKDGRIGGPRFLDWWTLGDPRFKEPRNPLFAPHLNAKTDWRKSCSMEKYREFYQFTKIKLGGVQYRCDECYDLRRNCERIIQAYRATKKKAKKEGKEIGELTEAQLLGCTTCTCHHDHGQSNKVQEIFTTTKETPPKETEKKPKDEKSKEKKKADKNNKENNKEKSLDERKSVFSGEARVTDVLDYSLATGKDAIASKVAGFKVIKIEDEKNGMFEVNVSVTTLKTDDEEVQSNESKKNKMKEQLLNTYILTADILRAKIDGLPKQLEWWEGRGFAIAILNYETEEREFTKKWTNFALKISGFEEVPIKQMMIKLLFYVAKRKRRTCYGWSMEVDDVVTCMLPEDSPDIGDLSISIQRGFRFEDRLIDEERDSLLKHQPNLRLDKVLMGMEAGDAAKVLTEKEGEDKIRCLCGQIAGRDLYGTDLPVLDIEKLRRKLNNKTEVTPEDILWEQIMQDPEKFEFFVLMEKEKESNLWEIGMKTMDIRYYLSHKNPTVRVCPVCKIVGQDCSCLMPMCISPDIVKFMDKSDFREVKLLGEADGPELPKMSYKELNSFIMDDKEKNKDKKRKKGDSRKVKNKVIELPDLPKRFKDVGIQSEKTTISIPAKPDTPLIGNVPLDSNDKADKMAPIPGLTSSLNITFQNEKKEQTITVSLGAYMPEEKLNQLAEKKELLKLFTEEDKRQEKAMTRGDKKKKKREKSGKSRSAVMKNKEPDAKDSDSLNVTTKEKTAELTAMFLNEILGKPDSYDAEKQLTQHLGLSHKKQQNQKKDSSSWASYEKKQMLRNKIAEEKGGEKATGEDKGDSNEDNLEIGNTNTDLPEITEDMKQVTLKEESGSGGEENGTDGGSEGSGDKEMKSELKPCWNCRVVEPRRKAFKKCQKCKEEGVVDCRYYCGRDCQVADWKNRHKTEHKDGTLK